jgi:hypothetical protein
VVSQAGRAGSGPEKRRSSLSLPRTRAISVVVQYKAHAQTAGSEAFELKKVGDGVWAAVAATRYKVNSNATVIETNDGLVIVDSHSKPSAAQTLTRKSRGSPRNR